MEIRLRILEGRRSRLEERLDRVQDQLDRTQREMDRYATELQRHGVESVEREVRWLSELIDAGTTQGHPRQRRAAPPSSTSADSTTNGITNGIQSRRRARWVRYE